MSRSLGLTLGFVLTLISSVAVAEEAARPQVLSGRTMGHRIDGCSLARSTLTVSSSFSMTLQPDGHVRLRVEHATDTHTMHMGQIGDGPISSAVTLDHTLDVLNLEGRLRHQAHGLAVRFLRSTEQHAHWMGYGTLPLGPPVARDVNLWLQCEESVAQVERADHTSASEPFFACRFASGLFPNALDMSDDFPLSAREIVRDTYTHFPGHAEGTTYAWAPLPTP